MKQLTISQLSVEDARHKYGPWAVIAGGSDGTGEAYAHHLAAVGINIMLASRRKDVLEAVAGDLRGRHGVETRVLVQDLMHPDAARNMLDASSDLDVGIYVSNAGVDGTGAKFFEEDAARWERMITMNVRTLTDAVHGFGNRFLERGRGGIVVMSSGVALAGTPYLTLYAATKGYGMVLVEGVWGELQGTDVEIVGVLAPTMDTPFYQREVAGRGFILADVYAPADIVEGVLAKLGHGPLMMFQTADGGSPDDLIGERYKNLQVALAAGKSFFSEGEKIA